MKIRRSTNGSHIACTWSALLVPVPTPMARIERALTAAACLDHREPGVLADLATVVEEWVAARERPAP